MYLSICSPMRVAHVYQGDSDRGLTDHIRILTESDWQYRGFLQGLTPYQGILTGSDGPYKGFWQGSYWPYQEILTGLDWPYRDSNRNVLRQKFLHKLKIELCLRKGIVHLLKSHRREVTTLVLYGVKVCHARIPFLKCNDWNKNTTA